MDLREVSRDLLTGDPVGFVTARDEAAARAKESGDAELARHIKKLRKPTTAAWAVNLLADREHDELRALLDLGERLRSAQRELRGDELRELAAERTRLLDRLTGLAVDLAAERGQKIAESGREQITQTLTAALSDPEAARQVEEATLTKPLEYSGFGLDDLAVAAVRRQAGNGAGKSRSKTGGSGAKTRRSRSKRREEDGDTGEAELVELRDHLSRASNRLDETAEDLRKAERAEQEAQERCERLREELAEAESELKERRRETKTARHEHERASKARDQATKALDERS
ncbi:hypothetical protein EIL87_18665 [Saccharopolyspora rhizosphaerae]|uniref:Uncharacterized protein n=1 Tax=Saccharopolyspora rhizosphaerae TaxID=2492662 RepID=A0A426JNP8_9PSEU|nr:hypothetical protein [Saccharopolyspora rhizosphaerae]RRO14761.1 hypothetical protein EIL87_18665 [Saccharopolyspora rhizosphaerae]